jgi:hypothetical protein
MTFCQLTSSAPCAAFSAANTFPFPLQLALPLYCRTLVRGVFLPGRQVRLLACWVGVARGQLQDGAAMSLWLSLMPTSLD